MKKLLVIPIFIAILIAPIKAFATSNSPSVNVIVDGEFATGNIVDVKFKINDANNFYGAQLEYTYNSEAVEIVSIDGGEFIREDGANLFEPFKEIVNDNGVARYAFTYTGDYKGKNGTGDFCVIKLKIKDKDKFKVSKENTYIKLVERKADEMVSMNFDFNEFKCEETNSSDNNTNSDTKPVENSNNNSTNITPESNNNEKTNNTEKNEEVDVEENNTSKDDSIDKDNTKELNEKDDNNSEKEDGRVKTLKPIIIGSISVIVCFFIGILIYKNKRG